MKILFLIPKFSGGGAEFVARQWIEYLGSNGVEIVVATTNLRSSDPRPDDVRVIDVGRSAVRAVSRLRKSMAVEQPDVVVALMPYWNLLAIVASRGLSRRPRIVISGRNMATHLRGSFGFSYRMKQVLARRFYRWADEFVAISHPVAGEAIALYGLDPARVSVVFNPSLKGAPDQTKRTIDPEAPIAIVAPARLVHQKRPHLVVEAAVAHRDATGDSVEVHFFGVGPLSESVAALAAQHDMVAHMHGWTPDWTADLPTNAVVVLPSLSEGFGNVLVEAARAGVPSVVTSRALGVADAVVPGVTGVLIAGDSPLDFADGIKQALDIGESDYSGWLSNFTKERSGAALMSRLRALAGEG